MSSSSSRHARETSSSGTPHGEVYMYSRRDEGLGDRLAVARSRRPEDVPPAPQAQAAGGTALPPPFQARHASHGTPLNSLAPAFEPSGLFPPSRQGSVLLPSDTHSLSRTLAPVPRSRPFPRHGGVKGSYISPYDSGGRTPGNPRLPASSTTWAEFEAKYGSSVRRGSNMSNDSNDTVIARPGRNISVDMSSPVATANVVRPAPPKRTFDIHANAKERVLLLGPFRLVRAQCMAEADTAPGMREMGKWLDEHMHEDLHKVHTADPMLPGVVYTVTLPMIDEHWLNYHLALKFFAQARALHDVLAVGKESFDKVTAEHMDSEGELTYPQLVVEGVTLENVLAGMVKGRRLGIPWDWARMLNRPDMVPKEYGGKLKEYVS